jgi:hypothetical protein
MTVILQHQFWDLNVSNEAFEVGLSFGGIPERLRVPFDAIIAFFDPAVNFGLQFVKIPEDAAAEIPQAATEPPRIPERKPPRETPKADASPAAAATEQTATKNPDKPSGGGEVVRLDRFRKK